MYVPSWLSRAEYDAMPARLAVRELLVRVRDRAKRVLELVVVTTLADAGRYLDRDLGALYRRRWQAETCQADCTSSDRWCSTPGGGYDQRRRAA
ncbi:hypothetical protein [Tautonia plasticadhaerens]|uniref:Uncharacterized protein n=1 Tax=Tautonia plasticadhaerens TaxID=2527974 RepID=A0A518H614_9BACT|nr:hypothetical protein [Tautonia plasticadhaerens]QDV36284.1 hypothetical protein ElP_42030 [Tautonia plasticadhaerens]